jgi:hypothetical protein
MLLLLECLKEKRKNDEGQKIMAGLGKQTRGNGIARSKVIQKVVMHDMSEEHEGMESKAEEAKEYSMEEKGYKETKSGKMKKADS